MNILSTENKNEKKITEIIEVKEFEDEKLVLKNGTFVAMLQIEPINFKLKSFSEQRAILHAYKTFLKGCDFDFQIFVQTQKADIDKHIKEIEKCVSYEEEISDMAEDYIKFIRDLSNLRSSMSRKFFIVLKIDEKEHVNKINKIRGSLVDCGNLVRVCKRKELNKVLANCFKKIS